MIKSLLSRLRGRFSPPQAEEPPQPLFTAEYVQEYARRFHAHQEAQKAPRKFQPLLMETRCSVLMEENGVKVKKEVECPGREQSGHE